MSQAGIQSSDGSVKVVGGGISADLSVTGGGGGGFTAGGDLSGTSTLQKVIGIQGVSVSAATPTTGQALILTGGLWTPTAIPLGISPGTGIGVAASSGIYTISNTGVTSWNGRTAAVTLSAADVEALFTAQAQLFVGTGSGTGTLLAPGSTGQVLTVKSDGSLFWNTPTASPVTSVFGRTGVVVATSGDYTVAQVTGAAPLASPALTGTPTAPTQNPLTNNTDIATTAYTDLAVGVETTRAEAAEAGLMNGLTPTTVQTSAFTATPNQLVLCDASGGSFTVKLPNAPANETLLCVLAVAAPGTNTLTIQTQGSDTILNGVATTATIRINGEAKLWQYVASTKIWEPISQIPLTSLTSFILNNSALTGVPTAPTAAAGDNTTQVATDAFVTTAVANAIAGVNPAVAVQAATTAAGDTSALAYNNGASGIGATLTGTINTPITIDGVLLNTLGQRLLVKNDTQSPSGAFNGIYVLTVISTAGTAPVFTRALDYDTPSDINNTGAIPVVSGTANASTSWLLTSLVATVGTSPLTYTGFTLAPTTLMTKAVYDAAAIAQQVLGTTATQTVTNKRITRRSSSTAGPGATPSMDTDSFDLFEFTALATAITSMTTNLTGTPVDGDLLWVALTDNGTARAITWGASFEASTVPLPTTTVLNVRLDALFAWNTVTSKWRCIAVA